MIDPLLSLAFAMHSAKGIYALLLGSGASRGAGIPTGWEVVQDLCRRLAALSSEECGDEPDRWYRHRFGKPPDYSELLDELGSTPSERREILRGYFEPTEEDRENGNKVPGRAHRAIAALVSSGHVRCIITTNFDRLIEQAITDAGISPTVISTPDGIKGAVPLTHARCYVLKLHGDYLDFRIRNTLVELAKYDRDTNRLLNRIFDEFGLVVCGWSADWDAALCAAIERCPSRRFTTFWAARGALGEPANRLVAARDARLLTISSADSFFSQLAEKVGSLERLDTDHPLSPAVAAAMAKKYVAEDRYLPQLSDLVTEESERTYTRIEQLRARVLKDGHQAIPDYLTDCTRLSQTFFAMLAEACCWARGRQASVIASAIQNIGRSKTSGGTQLVTGVGSYPGAAALYVAGVSAVGGANYGMLAELFDRVKLREFTNEGLFICEYPWHEIHATVKLVPGYERWYVPFSEFMHTTVRAPLRARLPDDAEYDDAFDRFEYLMGATAFSRTTKQYRRALAGRWLWRPRYKAGKEISFAAILTEEANSFKDDWPPIRAGLFGGSHEQFRALAEAYHSQLESVSR
ncbi:MAG TPA: SIR2 family protein [Pirellulales bacterium]|nr:SIR2 family protein [Pirellulales bacterium]